MKKYVVIRSEKAGCRLTVYVKNGDAHLAAEADGWDVYAEAGTRAEAEKICRALNSDDASYRREDRAR